MLSDGKKISLLCKYFNPLSEQIPEKKEVEKFWIEASNFSKNLLNWKEIELELDASNYRDKYGRLLGYVWVKSSDVISSEAEKSVKRLNNDYNKEQIPPLQSEWQV